MLPSFVVQLIISFTSHEREEQGRSIDYLAFCPRIHHMAVSIFLRREAL
jgi:hypothetical protein